MTRHPTPSEAPPTPEQLAAEDAEWDAVVARKAPQFEAYARLMGDYIGLRDRTRTLRAENARLREDAARTDELLKWTEDRLGLHDGLEIGGVATGYEVCLTRYDGAETYAYGDGETLLDALRAARKMVEKKELAIDAARHSPPEDGDGTT